MNIGFDLDKIFVNSPSFIPDKIIEILYKGKNNGNLLYRFPPFPEQLLRKASHHFLLRPPIVENIQFIEQLYKDTKHRHYLISSRFGFLRNETDRLVQKYSFDKLFNELHFNFNNQQPHLFKNETIKKLKIHRYIDDDLPLLYFLAKESPKTRFFWLNPKQNTIINKNLFAISQIRNILEN